MKSKEPNKPKTYGIRNEDMQMLKELQVSANNMQRHLSMFLVLLARDQFGYRETDDLVFEVDWEKKSVTIREQGSGEQSEFPKSGIETA